MSSCKSTHRLCWYSYMRLRIRVPNSTNSFCVLSLLLRHIPYSKGLQRVGGHSKRLPTQFKVSFIEQRSSYSAAVGCLPCFHLRLWLRNSVHLSKIDEKFSCWNEAQGMSHKSRLKDQTGLTKRSDCFQKLLAPVHLHTRYCCIFCCQVGCVVYCLNFSDLGPWRARNSLTL